MTIPAIVLESWLTALVLESDKDSVEHLFEGKNLLTGSPKLVARRPRRSTVFGSCRRPCFSFASTLQ